MAESVHLTIWELLEHAASVQAVAMAAAGTHVVGMVQEERALGSQQPWTPNWVFVAQMKVGLKHVIEDSAEELVAW
tara:strand:+ start:19598 stop:19825 length:228 start_codon:yes stop_codon:yes gene_type:complete